MRFRDIQIESNYSIERDYVRSSTMETEQEIANRMRGENFEQFQTLVRMHLSFELDLNTDTVDDVVHTVKLVKTKKLFAFPKKSKHLSSNSTKSTNPPFNVSHFLTAVSLAQIQQMISFLMIDHNIIQEGIFRRTGSVARQNELRRRLNDHDTLDFNDGVYTVHDCASVLKAVLADLPEPLLTDSFYVIHCQIAELCNSHSIDCSPTKETRLLHSIQLLLLLLPIENRSLFLDIINMLKETTKYESSNKMSAESLATLFTPHLICPRKLAPEALHSISQNLSGMISFMITKGEELQNIPPKLATDIRAYFLEQKRKKILSPDVQLLDESVTSDSTANTVYTFIDREKTAEAHISNPTDTALAQLYAYIQTLPESSKKRKLIKQFNRENGQGTPLQQQMLMRLQKGNNGQRPNKSIGGSIKKHIFHTSLGSKTPKRSSHFPLAAVAASTPVNRKDVNVGPKPRLVFQTPTQIKSTPNSVCMQTPTVATPQTNLVTPVIKKTPVPTISETCEIENAPVAIAEADSLSEGTSDENKSRDEAIQTPATFNMNKFITCFKSEPNLSKALSEKNDDVPMLNRGRFIAKKLLGGVSMVNLRFPFGSNAQERKSAVEFTPKSTRDAAIINRNIEGGIMKKIVFDNDDDTNTNSMKKDETIGTPRKEIKEVHVISGEDRIDDDEDDVDFDEKENLPDVECDQPTYLAKLKHASIMQCGVGGGGSSVTTIGCISRDNISISDSMIGDSVSPITKSTHRMSKAMQESIMTPRSRKPVIIGGAMHGISDENYHKSIMNFVKDDGNGHATPNGDANDLHNLNGCRLLNASLHKSKSESDLLPALNACMSEEEPMLNTIKMSKSTSEETLSTPFRLLMTTPIDSSFSSQSDDFENLNDSDMSESLIYCLNGNEPVCLTPITSCATPMSGRRIFDGSASSSSTTSCIKRPHATTSIENICDRNTPHVADRLYVDYGCINPKKNHLELDETAL